LLAAAVAAAAAVSLVTPACTPSEVYEPPEWTRRLECEIGFDSAAVLDESHVVFTSSEGDYRPVAPDPLWGRGRREFVRDVKRIGVLNLDRGEARVVHTEMSTRLGDGNGDYAVVDARGSSVLVFRERSTERGVLMDPGGWFVLDLATDALAAVDVDGVLAMLELELAGPPRLADGRGAICVAARPRGEGSTQAEFAELVSIRAPAGPAGEAPHGVFGAPDAPWIPRRLGRGRVLAVGMDGLAIERPDDTFAALVDPRDGSERALETAELAAMVAAAHPGPIEVDVVGDGARLHVRAGSGDEKRAIVLDVETVQ